MEKVLLKRNAKVQTDRQVWLFRGAVLGIFGTFLVWQFYFSGVGLSERENSLAVDRQIKRAENLVAALKAELSEFPASDLRSELLMDLESLTKLKNELDSERTSLLQSRSAVSAHSFMVVCWSLLGVISFLTVCRELIRDLFAERWFPARMNRWVEMSSLTSLGFPEVDKLTVEGKSELYERLGIVLYHLQQAESMMAITLSPYRIPNGSKLGQIAELSQMAASVIAKKGVVVVDPQQTAWGALGVAQRTFAREMAEKEKDFHRRVEEVNQLVANSVEQRLAKLDLASRAAAKEASAALEDAQRTKKNLDKQQVRLANRQKDLDRVLKTVEQTKSNAEFLRNQSTQARDQAEIERKQTEELSRQNELLVRRLDECAAFCASELVSAMQEDSGVREAILVWVRTGINS